LKKLIIEHVKGKVINEGVNEREVRLLASPYSQIKREDFSVGVTIIQPGHVHEEHRHVDHQELIVVLGGEGIARVSGEEFIVSRGCVIDLEKNEPHKFINNGESNLELLWIYSPPGPEKKFLL